MELHNSGLVPPSSSSSSAPESASAPPPAARASAMSVDPQAPRTSPDSTWTVKDLKEFCKEHGLRGYSALKKEELTALIGTMSGIALQGTQPAAGGAARAL
jgi:hypothetical protein